MTEKENNLIVQNKTKEYISISKEDTDNLLKKIEYAISNRTNWQSRIDTARTLCYESETEIVIPKNLSKNVKKYHFPLILDIINTLMSEYLQLLTNAHPICGFKSISINYMQSAVTTKMERLMSWLLNDIMVYTRPMGKIIYDMLLYGVGIAKVDWRYEKTFKHEKKLNKDFDPQILYLIEQYKLLSPKNIEKEINNVTEKTGDEVLNIPSQEELEQQQLQIKLNTIDLILNQLYLSRFKKTDVKIAERIFNQLLNGTENIIYETEMVVYDYPEIRYVPIRNFIVPLSSPADIRKAPWVAEVAYMTKEEIQLKSDYGEWSTDVVNNILDKYSILFEEEQSINTLNTSTMVELDDNGEPKIAEPKYTWEEEIKQHKRIPIVFMYRYQSINGIQEKVETIFSPLYTEAVLVNTKLPFDHNQFPYVSMTIDFTADSYYELKGWGFLLKDYQRVITQVHNNKLWYQRLSSAPIFTGIDGAVTRDIELDAGSVIFGQGDDALKELRITPKDLIFEKEEMIIRTLAEKFAGVYRMMPNQGENVKAKFVTYQAIQSNRSANYRLSVFKTCLSALFYQVLTLWLQYGNSNVSTYITGLPANELSKLGLIHEYEIAPIAGGHDIQRTMQLQTLIQFYPYLAQSPSINKHNLDTLLVKLGLPEYEHQLNLTEEQAIKNIMAQQLQATAIAGRDPEKVEDSKARATYKKEVQTKNININRRDNLI